MAETIFIIIFMLVLGAIPCLIVHFAMEEQLQAMKADLARQKNTAQRLKNTRHNPCGDSCTLDHSKKAELV